MADQHQVETSSDDGESVIDLDSNFDQDAAKEENATGLLEAILDLESRGVDPDPVPAEPAGAKAANDVVKHIVVAATGLISISLIFRRNLVSGQQWDWLIETSWLLLGFSVLAGFGFMLRYVRDLDRRDRMASAGQVETVDLDDHALRLPWLLQVLLFLAGLACFVAYGFLAAP